MPDRERFRAIDEVFREALRAPRGERERVIEERCGGDLELLREVKSLLQEDDVSRGALDAPAINGAIRLSQLGVQAGAAAVEPIPERIGRYRVLSRLGAGGMGIVYEAEQENPRRKVAVKVISQGLVSAATLRRFEHEAQVLGRLEHPGIARIYEAGVQDTGQGQRPFFAMELVRGVQVLEYAREHGLKTRERLALFALVCDGVQHAHQRGVVHRDLKPANILVDESGQPRILDFGVARAIDDEAQVTSRTDAGQIIGTLAYMSPEQAGGTPHEVDTRSDVYALGVLGYELLTGSGPYELKGKSIPEALRIVCDQEAAPLSTVNRSLRGDVQTIFGKALEKDKARRYDSAAALADDVRRFLTDQVVSARAPSAMYQVRKFARRHRAIVGATGLLVVGLAGAAGFSFVQAARAEAARERADAEAGRARAERAAAVQRFEEVRALAKVLIFDLHDAIQHLPGATPAREQIVSEGLKYLDALAGEAGADRELVLETVSGYTRIAEVLGNPGSSSLGKYNEALEAYERGLTLLAALPAPSPGEDAAGTARTGSRLHANMAELLRHLGRGEEALSHARDASAVMRPLRGESGATATALATALAREVSILTWMGKPQEAMEVHKEVYAIDLEVLAKDPGAENARRNVISDLIKLGDMHRYLREYPEAIGFYRQAIEKATDTLDLSVLRNRRQRNVARLGLGKSLRLAGDSRAALVEHEAALEECRALVAADEQNIRPLEDLRVALQDLGDVRGELGQFEASIELHREYIAINEDLAGRVPEGVDYLMGIGFGHERVGDRLVALGRGDEALLEYDLALRQAMMVREKDASVGVAHEVVVVVNRAMGQVWLARSGGTGSEESRRAAEHFRAALEGIGVLEARSITPRNSMVDRGEIEGLLVKAGG